MLWSFVFHVQAITSTGTKKGELFLADVATQLKNKNITTDIKVDTNSNVSHGILSLSHSWDFIYSNEFHLSNSLASPFGWASVVVPSYYDGFEDAGLSDPHKTMNCI